MGDGRRVQRAEKELRAIVGTYILTRFDDLPHKMVTINNVICSKDLRNAKIFVGAIGDHKVEPVVEALNRGVSEIQAYVGRELPMRYCPRLKFFEDHTTEQILHVEQVLRELEQNRQDHDSEMARTPSR